MWIYHISFLSNVLSWHQIALILTIIRNVIIGYTLFIILLSFHLTYSAVCRITFSWNERIPAQVTFCAIMHNMVPSSVITEISSIVCITCYFQVFCSLKACKLATCLCTTHAHTSHSVFTALSLRSVVQLCYQMNGAEQVVLLSVSPFLFLSNSSQSWTPFTSPAWQINMCVD
jgi:hypothetical protein